MVSGSSPALQALETSFHQDLNGDGTIGPSLPTTVIESLGSTSLVKVGSNFYLDSISSGIGPTLKSAGAAVDATQTTGWAPIGAEQTATGYEVAWKLPGADQYTVWATDGAGNYTSSLLGVVSGSNAALKSLEPSFQQDLNGDGLIGVTAPVASSGLSSNPLWHSASNDVFVFGPGTSTGSIADAEQLFAGLDGFWSNEAQSSQFQALWQPAGHAIVPLENHDSLALMNLHAFELHNDFLIR